MPYPSVASGLGTQVVAGDEGAFGVAANLTAGRSYEIKSETLALKKTTVQGQGLAAGRVYDRSKRRVLTNYDMGGAIVMDLPTRQLAFWLNYMIGSWGQTLVAPTQIGSTGIYQSIHQGLGGSQLVGGMLGHSFSVQKGLAAADNGAVEPITEVGCKLTDWEIKCAVGQIAELSLTIDGRNELAGPFPNGGVGSSGDPLNAATPALASFGVPTSGLGEGLFHFREATIYTGFTYVYAANQIARCTNSTYAAAQIRDIDIKHAVKFEANRYFLGSAGFKAEQIENGFRMLTGQFTAEWQSSMAWYNAFAGDVPTSMELTFVGPTVGASNYLLDVIIPNIRLDGESPKAGGPAVLTQAVGFTGLDDETTCPIQVIYQSEDTAR
jgi:hypothetical protein